MLPAPDVELRRILAVAGLWEGDQFTRPLYFGLSSVFPLLNKFKNSNFKIKKKILPGKVIALLC